MAARTDSLTESDKGLIQKVLGDPSLFPDAFKQWIPRWVQYNVNFQLQRTQLPTLDPVHLVGATGNAQFLNSWVNFGASDQSAGYWIDLSGIVHLQGTVKSGTINSVIFQLPAGYRPASNVNFAVVCNGAFGQIKVDTAGNVTMMAGGSNAYITLEGISFKQFA